MQIENINEFKIFWNITLLRKVWKNTQFVSRADKNNGHFASVDFSFCPFTPSQTSRISISTNIAIIKSDFGLFRALFCPSLRQKLGKSPHFCFFKISVSNFVATLKNFTFTVPFCLYFISTLKKINYFDIIFLELQTCRILLPAQVLKNEFWILIYCQVSKFVCQVLKTKSVWFQDYLLWITFCVV